MTLYHRLIVGMPVVLSLGACVLWSQTPGKKYIPLDKTDDIKNYKNWFCVTPRPVYLLPAIATLCRPATPEEVKEDDSNPHMSRYFNVYVNPLGKKAMLTAKNPRFPVGSIIVKEKLPSEKSHSPELLTVMIKRKKGYDRAHGDWEYLVTNGKGTKIQECGKMETCQSCHASQKTTDYVYRNYDS